MDINPVSSMATSLSAGTSVLKRTIDTQAQTALILIDSIAQTPVANATNLPPNLGQNVNTTA